MPELGAKQPSSRLLLLVADSGPAGRAYKLPRQLATLGPAVPRSLLQAVGEPGRTDLPGEQLVTLEESDHACSDAPTATERVCNYKSLVLYDGRLYYMSSNPRVRIPGVDMLYGRWYKGPGIDMEALFGVGHGLEVVSPAALPWAGGSNITTPIKARVLDNVYLWDARMANNMGHALGEEVMTFQNSLCQHLGSCTYSQRLKAHIFLLDTSRVLKPINETLGSCMSRQPVLSLSQWSGLGGGKELVLLRNVTAGIGPDCRANGDCGKGKTPKRTQRMSQQAIATYRQRIADCMGFDAQAVASLNPVRVVVLDRLYESARHFLNIRSMEQRIRQLLPDADVQVVYMEVLPIEQQMQVVASASILLMMHGAALGFWPFLPRKAVAIHVVPHPDSDPVQAWGHRMAWDLAFANITAVPLTNRKAERLRYRLHDFANHPHFRKLSDEDRLALLERGKCPEGAPFATYCSMHIMRKHVDLDLELDHLEEVMGEAMDSLLAKFSPEETAHLAWRRQHQGQGGESSGNRDSVISAREEALAAYKVALAALDEALAAKDEALAAKDEALALSQALEAARRVARDRVDHMLQASLQAIREQRTQNLITDAVYQALVDALLQAWRGDSTRPVPA
ncbi:hypothetical protein N2152v2_010244 [Parachlorella kessleri]